MQQPNIHSSIRRLIYLFETYGDVDYIGESVSILNHSLQAAQFARNSSFITNFPLKMQTNIILGALLHDIGHILGLEAHMDMDMNGYGILNHEIIGSNFIELLGFTNDIKQMISSHVLAKRYLCSTNKDYYNNLSDASKMTLTFQGNLMSLNEIQEFELIANYKILLFIRQCDENGKNIENNYLLLNDYILLLQQSLEDSLLLSNKDIKDPYSFILSSLQYEYYNKNNYLKCCNLLSFFNISINEINQWVNEISQLNEPSNKCLFHYELNSLQQRQLCRCENFINYHSSFGYLVKVLLQSIVSQLFHEEAILFKEKINFKLPNGAGFAAHQDSNAYIGLAKDHISVMIAIDACTIENGCLQVASGQWNSKSNLPLSKDGIIQEDQVKLDFHPIECQPGDVVFFSGYLPHKSSSNLSNSSRRVAFITYNPLSQGDHHDKYYEAKHQGLQGFDGKQTLSFTNDFLGVIVE